MPDNRDGPGYIYILKRCDGWYKIGRTAQPKNRFRQWRWMSKRNHWDLKPLLLFKVSNQRLHEKMYHSLFKHKRTEDRHNGMGPRMEWFSLDSDDLRILTRWIVSSAKSVLILNGEWI